MSDGEELVLVLAPVSMSPESGHVPGATHTPCGTCGTPCWIAPSGRVTLYRRMCIPCAMASEERDRTAAPLMHVASIVEVAEHTGMDAFDLADKLKAVGFEMHDE